jgi:hypothetical protein
MSISTTPAPTPPKKRGLGCCGCGCSFLLLLVALFVLLTAGICYVGYKTVMALTSDTPATIPAFDGGDDAYAKARGKLADFDHDVTNHQAATIMLSGDEINTLIAHDPDFARNHVNAFVSFTGTEGEVQIGFPPNSCSTES